MSILGQKTIMEPQLTDTLAALRLDIFRNINCVKLGQIESFNATKKTAQVKLLFKRVLPNGNVANYPVLVDCPVVTLQGDGAALQMPIVAGDQGLVFFSDRNIDAWFKTGGAAAPLSARTHDLSDGLILVGVNALTSSLEAYVASKVRLFYKGTTGAELSLADGVAKLKASKNNSAANVELEDQIVTIRNATTTLLTLLSGFIDVLTALEVVGPLALTPASIAALTAYKLTLAELLA